VGELEMLDILWFNADEAIQRFSKKWSLHELADFHFYFYSIRASSLLDGITHIQGESLLPQLLSHLSIFSGNALADTHRSVLYYLPGQLSIQSS
jgi:hypothetical protein